MTPIISASDLKTILTNENLVIVHCGGTPDALENHQKGHIKHALFVDLNKHLSEIKDPAKGGRHPLPDALKFSQTLYELGIDKDSHVIIYDHKFGGNAAARFWWMLKAISHEKVQVLSGGYQAAEKAGLPIRTESEIVTKKDPYIISDWQLPLSSIEEIDIIHNDPNHLIIDVREEGRYAGDSEPIDLIAGHIPGAVNVPFMSNLDEEGNFKSPDVLKKKYQTLTESKETVVHCGSGVTACHTLLAMDYAGLPIPKLYVGSWSEWSRNNREMVTK